MTGTQQATCTVCLQPSHNVCSRCKTTRYCSRTCQQSHWKVHKTNCAILADFPPPYPGSPAPAQDSPTQTFPFVALPLVAIQQVFTHASSRRQHLNKRTYVPPSVSKWWYALWQQWSVKDVSICGPNTEKRLRSFIAMLDTHPGLLNEIQKVSFGVALDGPVFELGPYIRALIPGTKLTMRAKTNEIILGLSVHLKSMSNLHTLRIQCADTGEFGLPTAAVFLQSLPPSIKTLTLGFFWAGVLHNIDIDIHICPILARACRNMEKVTITLRCLCPSFFESVDAFPNLKELYIMVDAGYWYTCKNVCTRMQWPEGWKEFERAGLQNRHKVPNLRVFAMWNDQDWESAVYNLVDGSVFMVSAAERRARETEDAARRGNPRPEGGVSHNEMAELMTRRYPPGGPQRVTWTGVTMD